MRSVPSSRRGAGSAVDTALPAAVLMSPGIVTGWKLTSDEPRPPLRSGTVSREILGIAPAHAAADRDPEAGAAALRAADGSLLRVREDGEQRCDRDDRGDGDGEGALGGRERAKGRGERGAQRAGGDGGATLEPGLERAHER